MVSTHPSRAFGGRSKEMGAGRGVTLVELVVSMLIVSLIGLAGGRSFLLILRMNKESQESARVHDNARRTIAEMRQTCGNLVPQAIGSYAPYSREVDPQGMVVHQFVTRLQEYDVVEDHEANVAGSSGPESIEDVVTRYSVRAREEQGMSLRWSRQYLGKAGLLDAPLSAILSDRVMDFSIEPRFEEEVRESGVGGSGEEPVEVLAAFDVRIQYELPDRQSYSISVRLPVGSRPAKEQMEGQEENK